ncbi:hypothetical protein [Microbacterium thalassium]|uniref:Uncharacterized protein n=1 Tax=Microbacterium thalassium TaxID=362649 RepID=A0A7X0FTK2_9MICO|nr:hypothetical protein [Microbacterium thalassium]MBB6392756.1 hypothetical protein [Microbacterium thalassium]GLK23012.1 hypothetical protein GCM10017607_03300 [Microbacterium thalassium]
MPSPDRDLSPEEAENIARHAREGRLDTGDPEIRRVVSRANREDVRNSLWGDMPVANRRWLLFGGIAFVALWVVGLAVPLLLTFGSR